MLKYKNILVPYDGSAHAKKAMAQAADLAAAGEGTKLYIVSVCNMVSAMSNFDQVSIAEGCLTSKLSEDLEAQCRRDLKEAAAMVPEGVAHETVLKSVRPDRSFSALLKIRVRPHRHGKQGTRSAEGHFHGIGFQLYRKPGQVSRAYRKII